MIWRSPVNSVFMGLFLYMDRTRRKTQEVFSVIKQKFATLVVAMQAMYEENFIRMQKAMLKRQPFLLSDYSGSNGRCCVRKFIVFVCMLFGSIFFGRIFCGWLCSMGVLLDGTFYGDRNKNTRIFSSAGITYYSET